MKYGFLGVSLLPFLAVATALPAAAQQIEDEIVVTAQRREQGIQDVPISVQAVSGETIIDQGITKLEDLSTFVPGMNVTNGFTGQTLAVRGITTNQGNTAFEQSVSTFIDGQYFGRSVQSLNPFMDIERVEVLKGAQPTFFGQNAIAGAMNITTRGVGSELNGYGSVSYGTEGEQTFEGAVGVPLTDTFGLRFAFRDYGTDGYLTNTVTGGDEPARDQTAYRLVAEWDPIEALSVRGKIEHSEFNQTGFLAQQLDCNAVTQPSSGPPNPNICGQLSGLVVGPLNGLSPGIEYTLNNQIASGGLFHFYNGAPVDPTTDFYRWFNTNTEDVESDIGLLSVEYDFGPVVLSSLTGQSNYEYEAWRDFESSPAAYQHVRFTQEYEQFSQELRLTSDTDGFMDWMVGLYYQSSDLETDNNLMINRPGGAGGPFGAGVQTYDESVWQSAFIATTFHLSDAWSLDLGLRYTDVSKDGFQTGESPASPTNLFPEWTDNHVASEAACATQNVGYIGVLTGPPGSNSGCVSDDYDTTNTSYNVNLTYELSDDVSVYGRYVTGFKAGGFNASPGPAGTNNRNFTFEDEEVETFEIGLRSTLFDRRVRLNLTAFSTDYTNLQVSSFDPGSGSFRIENAAAASQSGLEAELQWAATENLDLGVTASLLDAKFDTFTGGQCSEYEQYYLLNGCAFGGGVTYDNSVVPTASTTDRSGYQMLHAPEWSVAFNAQYNRDLTSNIGLRLNADVFVTDDYQVSDRFDPRGVQGGYTRTNLRAALQFSSGFEFAIYGRNLEDEQTLQILGPSAPNSVLGGTAVLGRGSSYGAEARYRF